VGPPFSDTDPDAARVHRQLLRAASPQRRLRLALSLSHTMMSLSRGSIAQRCPDATARAVALQSLALFYGQPLADEVANHLANRMP
jgi:hypothetical protein